MQAFQPLFRMLLTLGLLGASQLALAHAGDSGSAQQGFIDGLLHPLHGGDHLAAVLAVGIWSAMTLRSVWLAPLTFVVLMVAGALGAFAGLTPPLIEPMIATSLLVMGLLIALRQRLSTLSAGGLVGLFALFHGAAHGAELGALPHGPMLAGMVLSTAVLLLAGVLLARLVLSRHAWLPQLVGALVVLLGGVLLVQSL